MEGPPYRAMPQPLGPPRAWRPIVEQCLAAFNGLTLAGLVVFAAASWSDARYSHTDVAMGTLGAAATPLLALLGFMGRSPLLRALMLFPSILGWSIVGVFLAEVAVSAIRQGSSLSLLYAALALLFVAAGALSAEAAFQRLRRAATRRGTPVV